MLALLMHGSEKEIFVCDIGRKRINLQSLVSDQSIRLFFSNLAKWALSLRIKGVSSMAQDLSAQDTMTNDFYSQILCVEQP